MVTNPFRRSTGVPAEVLAQAPTLPREKVLAGAATVEGSWILGTSDALILVPAAAPSGISVESNPSVGPDPSVELVETRIPWERIERADWDRDESRITIAEVGSYGEIRPSYTLGIDDPGVLVELIRERVTASIVLQRHVPVEGRRGLFVIGRRPPRGHGEISWMYEFDAGVDPQDPEVAAAAERGLAAAAAELGL